MSQTLSTREGNLFRQVIRNYEDKQYKRGLKAAEQLLKKNPKHGDTMAMKALILNAQGKTEEAFALGKEALTVNMKSHICWHVYGLLYRQSKNFEEAIKAYKFALKLESESPQIQRDLAILQVQMRDYQGYLQSRLAMLQAKPQLRQNWTGLAVAHHLAGNHQDAERILTTYEDTLKTPPHHSDIEHSEAILYKNMIIAESGDIQRALEHLESAAKHNLDRLAVMECRANYLSQLDRKKEAAKAWRALLDRNTEHPDYYWSLLKTLDIKEDDVAAKKAVFDKYAAKSPRSDAPRRIPLDFLAGDDFRDAARSYLALMLDKGVPSTFANLKHLYSDSFKKETLPVLAEEYLKSSRSSNGSDENASGDSSKGEAAALYFLAQHHDYHLSRDLAKAMEYCEEAIKLGPENVDFHMTKARIWKHHGNSQRAAEIMDYARSLDTKDRYINTKAAKYQLRDNQNEKALETMGLFTRADTPGGPLSDLLDMQCLWFLNEDGEAYARQANIGLALKRFHSVWKIFDIWQDDQFDFHSFSIRKGLIRAYVEMVRWEDRVREHPFYTRAALNAVKIYLEMHDRAAGTMTNGVHGGKGEADGDDEAENERKKAAKKAKKEAQKAEREATEKAAKQDPNKGKGKQAEQEASKKKDDDPLGLKLAETQDPLGDSLKFLSPLLRFSPKDLEARIAGFEVYLRRKKFVLALRCLIAARGLNPDHPTVHRQSVELRHALNSSLESLPPKVQEVLTSEFTAVPASADLKKLNHDFKAKHSRSPAHVLAAIRVNRLLGADKSQCAKEAVDTMKMDGTTLAEAQAVIEVLQNWSSGEAQAAKALARSKWPEASAFA